MGITIGAVEPKEILRLVKRRSKPDMSDAEYEDWVRAREAEYFERCRKAKEIEDGGDYY